MKKIKCEKCKAEYESRVYAPVKCARCGHIFGSGVRHLGKTAEKNKREEMRYRDGKKENSRI